MKLISDLYRMHKELVVSGIISLILLIVFLILQSRWPIPLQLETKWLILAGVPLLWALFAGGYIKTFKGFGIELESQLRNPLKELKLIAKDAIKDLPSDIKKSRGYLFSLPRSSRLQIERLIFYLNKIHYYDMEVVISYINALPNLKYIEIRVENDHFVGLLPISLFLCDEFANQNFNENGNNIERSSVERLIRSINEGTLKSSYEEELISERVNENESLIDILPRVRSSRHKVVAVVSDEGILEGIISKEYAEEQIANVVFAARKRV